MNANRFSEGDDWRQTDPPDGSPRVDGRPESPTHRSGQYPAVSGDIDVHESFEAPVPSPLPEATERTDHPFRRPFSSLLPGTRLEDLAPPASTPPSLRRPLSAAPPRRLGNCSVHRIALSPDGDCVLCRRETPPARGVGGLIGLALLLIAAGAWFFLL